MRIPLWLKVKAATAEAIGRAGGNKVCAAAVTRIDRVATFSDYANPNEMKRVIPLDTAVELDAFTMRAGHAPELIGLAAAELGHVLIKIPDAEGMDCVIAGSGKLAAKLGAVMTEVGAAVHDGRIDLNEAASITAKLEKLIVAAHALARQVAHEARQGGEEG